MTWRELLSLVRGLCKLLPWRTWRMHVDGRRVGTLRSIMLLLLLRWRLRLSHGLVVARSFLDRSSYVLKAPSLLREAQSPTSPNALVPCATQALGGALGRFLCLSADSSVDLVQCRVAQGEFVKSVGDEKGR